MKTHRRKINERNVMVDSNPDNDYDDGYSAGRYYYERKMPRIILASILAGQVLEILAYLSGLYWRDAWIIWSRLPW